MMKIKKKTAKIVYLLCGTIALFGATAGAQNHSPIDSLKRALQNAQSDTLRAHLATEIAGFYGGAFQFDSSFFWGQKAYFWAQKAGAPQYLAENQLFFGHFYYLKEDWPKAIAAYQYALRLFDEATPPGRVAKTYRFLGETYKTINDEPRALVAFLKAAALYKAQNRKTTLAEIYKSIASIYSGRKELDKALEFFQLARRCYSNKSNPLGVAEILNGMGVAYSVVLRDSLALSYYHQCFQYLRNLDSPHLLSNVYNNMGIVYLRQKNYKRALDLYHKSLHLSKQLNEPEEIGISLHNISNIYFTLNKPAQARAYNDSVLILGKQTNSKKILSHVYESRAQIDSAQGNYAAALNDYKLAILYRDSLFNEEKTKEIGKIEGKYEIEKGIEAEKQQEEAKAKETQRQNNLQYLLIFVGVAVFFLGLFFLGRLKIPFILSEGLIFLAFLMLFEYILIVTEPFLDKYTGNMPIQKLGLNIVLAGIFTPLHRFLEGRLKKQIIGKDDFVNL